jgi:hypothetical protein
MDEAEAGGRQFDGAVGRFATELNENYETKLQFVSDERKRLTVGYGSTLSTVLSLLAILCPYLIINNFNNSTKLQPG